MVVANDLLTGKQCVVAHVIDRDNGTDRRPFPAGKSQLPSRPPGLGFDPSARFAQKCLLRRVE